MKAFDFIRNLLNKEKKNPTTVPTIEKDNESEVKCEDVYTHAFDRPIKDKFVGTHRKSDIKYKKMKIKKEKSDKEDEFTM